MKLLQDYKDLEVEEDNPKKGEEGQLQDLHEKIIYRGDFLKRIFEYISLSTAILSFSLAGVLISLWLSYTIGTSRVYFDLIFLIPIAFSSLLIAYKIIINREPLIKDLIQSLIKKW